MSTVIPLLASRAASLATRRADLISHVARHRRPDGDVFWLKESAELLGILCCTGLQLPERALEPYAAFYEQLERQIDFFPQYYRFLLSICLDLEDLGMPGTKGEALCARVVEGKHPKAELSDLQRAEALRLLARRGLGRADPHLTARLHRFIDHSETFALPNKKAAYELTHIIYYLSQYGQQRPDISANALRSLEYAGLVAFLDQDIDLLAEVCAALRLAGEVPSPQWEKSVTVAHRLYRFTACTPRHLADDLHSYLVSGWASHLCGAEMLQCAVAPAPGVISAGPQLRGVLRNLSEALYAFDTLRSGDWARMKPLLVGQLTPQGQQILEQAEASTPNFEPFFEIFVRAP